MAIGRISGPLLKANLLRDGVDLAFETDLLFLDVINGRVGIHTTTPTHDLTISGTTRTTNLIVDNEADIATFTINTNVIASSNGTISLEPSGVNAVVYQSRILVNNNLQISTNTIQTTVTNSDLSINTLGTGVINLNANVTVNGDVHATGNITADGTIIAGTTTTSTLTSNISSNLIPSASNTYNLGSNPSTGGHAWATTYSHNVNATNVTTTALTANGINLVLPQGNIRYVSTTGNDGNAGVHENNPYLTIKYALSQAISGETVYIYPGTYTEIMPLTIPAGVSLKGTSLRTVIIRPTNGTIDHDIFLLNGETSIEDLTITGFLFNNANNTGYALRLANNFSITTNSPYVRNITVTTTGSVITTPDPHGFSSNDAGKGAFLDGSVANSASLLTPWRFSSVTFLTPNQESIIITNGIRINFTNTFTYYADKGLYVYSGTTGFAGIGTTRLILANMVGTWSIGNIISYYSADGVTLLASGTIASIVGSTVTIAGKSLGFTPAVPQDTSLAVYAQGTAQLSTAHYKFGSASLYLNNTTGAGAASAYVTVPSDAEFGYGTSDFTIEFWIYPTSTSITDQVIIDQRVLITDIAPVILLTSGNLLSFVVNGTARITGSTIVNLNTWYHVALARTGTSTKLFLQGVQQGATFTDSYNYIASPITIGTHHTFVNSFAGYIDDLRIEQVAKYRNNFTPPSVALLPDYATAIMLHFDGTNGATTFLSDGLSYQDIRTSAGGTANLITVADYSQFGADIRYIGSSNAYGNYGIYANGIGVTVQLTGHTFSYIGSGADSSDTALNDVYELQQITSTNAANVYYTASTEDGDFLIGDKFYIDQSTGEVLFNAQSLTLTSASGVTFTDGTNTTTLTSTEVATGNILISGNTIQSVTGAITVSAANGVINLLNNTYVTGNLAVTGDVNIGGNITIGDQTTDTVSFIAGINSNLVPATTAAYDLGTSSLRWNNAYLSRVEIDNLVIDNNTISTTYINDDLILTASGTGRIYIPTSSVQIDHNLTVGNNLTVTSGTTYLHNVGITGTITQTGSTTQTGDYTTSGNMGITGNIVSTGYLQLPQITITGNTVQTNVSGTDLNLVANGSGSVVVQGITVSSNTISSNTTNADITLVPQGTGNVVINSSTSLQLPIGTTLQRPGTPTNGMTRYNTTLSRYEGYTNGYWLQLSGVIDNSGHTKILAEATPGSNDNVLYFYANSNLTATIDNTKLYTQRLQTSLLDINASTISAISTNTDINFTTTGTGGVKLGNLSINNNTITNIVSGAVTNFTQTGTGYVSISGSVGVVIPSGPIQPSNPEMGMMRFNTYQQYVEIYNGSVWSSVSGVNSSITAYVATDIAIQAALIFG